MSSLRNPIKGFSLPELLVTTLISLISLALLAPSIKSGYNFLQKNFLVSQVQLSDQRLEKFLSHFFNNSEQIAGLRQVYLNDSEQLVFLISDSSVVGKPEGSCFRLNKTNSELRGILAVTASGYKLLKLNPDKKAGRELCPKDLAEEIKLPEYQALSSMEPTLAVIGVTDLVSLSLNSAGELRRISLLSGSNQKIVTELENFDVSENKATVTISWKLKAGKAQELVFSVANKKSSHLEWLNL